MKFAFRLVAVLSVSCFLAVPGVRATAFCSTPMQPILASAKPKLVKFRVQSNLKMPLDLKVGETLTTLQPGQTLQLRLPVGDQIIVATAIAGHPAGEVIVRVETSLDDATVRINP